MPDAESSPESEIELPLSTKRRIKRTSWNTEERETANDFFKEELSCNILPTTQKCIDAINSFEALKNRTPRQLKSWLQNQINGNILKRTTPGMLLSVFFFV